jgi:NADPH-dependent ferric siderophore reductase
VRGREGMYDRDIYAENPDLEVVLQTEFHALIVGFCDGPAIRQYLPPLPPPVHYSVHVCDDEELRRFTQRLDFLPTVLAARDLPADELLAAALRRAAEVQPDRYAFVVGAGRKLALLLRDDHARLMTILQRIR